MPQRFLAKINENSLHLTFKNKTYFKAFLIKFITFL